MPQLSLVLVALVTLVGCGNAKKDQFETEMKFFRSAESALVADGCTLLEKSAEEITLDCTGVKVETGSFSLENRLREFASRGAYVLEKDAIGEKKFLSDDERLRIQAKIALANKIRGGLVTR